MRCINLLRANTSHTRLNIKFSEEVTELKLSLQNIGNAIKVIRIVLVEAAPHLYPAPSIKTIRVLRKSHTLIIKTIQTDATMAGICETSSDLNCWNNVRTLLKTSVINNLIQFEARDITPKEYFDINTDNMNDAEKLTFANVVLLVI